MLNNLNFYELNIFLKPLGLTQMNSVFECPYHNIDKHIFYFIFDLSVTVMQGPVNGV